MPSKKKGSFVIDNMKHLKLISRSVFGFVNNNIGICVLVLIYTLVAILVGVYRYNAYLDGFDFTVFYEAIHKYSLFQLPDSSIRGLDSFDGDHFHPIVITLVPFYILFPSPYTLVTLQALFVASSILPVYLFIKSRFHSTFLALIGSVAYSLCGGLQWMLFFDFHEILFAVPLIAWSIYFIDKKQWRYLVVCLLLLAVTKEELYLYIGSVGVLLLLTRKSVKIGLGALFGGFGGFLFLNSIIMPLLAGTRFYSYWSYSDFGSSLSDAVKNTITNPLNSLKDIVYHFSTPDARKTIGLWFKPLLIFVPFLSPYIILAIPLILTRFLSDQSSYSVYSFHYGATVAPIIFLAFIDSIDLIRRFISSALSHRVSFQSRIFKHNFIGYALVICLSITLVLNTQINSPVLNAVVNRSSLDITTSEILNSESRIQKIVGDKSVIAPDVIAAHFATRDRIYSLRPVDVWDIRQDKIINPVPLSSVDYVILNSKLPLPDSKGDISANVYYLIRYHQELEKREFKKIYQDDNGWIVYKR